MSLSAAKRRELLQSDAAVGNRIAKAVELAGCTLVEVQRGTGLSYPYISDVSRGRFQTITVDNAHKFAEFFGCAIEDLFPQRESIAS